MAQLKDNWWQRNKYHLSGVVLVLSAWFYYQSLNPQFPAALESQSIGEFRVVPMPFNDGPPYLHDGVFVKDFLLMFEAGDIASLRQAYLSIGPQRIPLAKMQAHHEGLLHGSPHGQHVHALTSKTIEPGDKLWLTLENWQGEQQIMQWSVPNSW